MADQQTIKKTTVSDMVRELEEASEKGARELAEARATMLVNFGPDGIRHRNSKTPALVEEGDNLFNMIRKVFEFFVGQLEKTHDQEIAELLSRPKRSPCEYCGLPHLDYACDKQIESLNDKIRKYATAHLGEEGQCRHERTSAMLGRPSVCSDCGEEL